MWIVYNRLVLNKPEQRTIPAIHLLRNCNKLEADNLQLLQT